MFIPPHIHNTQPPLPPQISIPYLSTRARASTREERARARTPVMEPSFASSAIARTRVRVGSLVAAVGSRGAAVVNREAMRNALAERASMTTITPARDSRIEWEA